MAEGEKWAAFLEEFLPGELPGAEVVVYCDHGMEGPGAELSLEPIRRRELTYEEALHAENALESAMNAAQVEYERRWE